ncbi:MAG: pyridoxal phosphate-dependent decarboxylase family protein [Acidimicrobiia bacterium]
MIRPNWRPALDEAHAAAVRWLESVADRPVRPDEGAAAMMKHLDTDLGDDPVDAAAVIEELARVAEPGLMAMNSPRFHGWVIGGAMPAGVAADWLVAAWDQNTAMTDPTPAVGVVEIITARWVLDLLGLPAESGVGFVTGGQVANLVCLAAARSGVANAYGYDVDAKGLAGAPPITVVTPDHVHHTVGKALRLLGFGHDSAIRVPTDDNARLIPSELRSVLAATDGPVIVCAQAGEVNTGGIDRFSEIAEALTPARAVRPEGGVWLHVDGAIGLWGLASPHLRPRFAGIEAADSWSTDAHKWLNTPYDCGIAITAHPGAHRRALTLRADYLPAGDEIRNPIDWNPEMSRRARATAVYATMRALGRSGIIEMLDRLANMARLFGERLSGHDGVEVLNEIELNQVLVRFRDRSGDASVHTPAVLATVQESGVAYPTATVWRGEAAVRISVSNWMTDEDDVAATVEALLTAHEELRGA